MATMAENRKLFDGNGRVVGNINSCMEQMSAFIEECLVITNVSSDVIGVKDMYRHYNGWCKDKNVIKENSYPEFIQWFGICPPYRGSRYMERKGYANIKGQRKRVYTGIKKV